jgi:Fur family transcriptional regulator, ferric uptake regulator
MTERQLRSIRGREPRTDTGGEARGGYPRGRKTAQRAAVLAALMESADFTTAQMLHGRLLAAGERVGLTTVYRTLTALAGEGRADFVHDPAGGRLFRYRPAGEHRHYLVCRCCGRGLPVDAALVESWAVRTAESQGYTDLRHTVELTGICPRCRSEEHIEGDRAPIGQRCGKQDRSTSY